MESVTTYSEIFFNSFQSFVNTVVIALPKILGAIVIVLLGWLLARLLAKIVSRVLQEQEQNFISDKMFVNNAFYHELLSRGTAAQYYSQ